MDEQYTPISGSPVTPAPAPNLTNPTNPQGGFTPYQSPQKPKRSQKYTWIVLVIVLLIAGGGLFLWLHRPGHQTPQQTTESTPEVSAPLVTTAKPGTIGPGTYTVGPDKNIVPGLYAVTPGTQQSGTFTVVTPSSNYNVVLNYNANGDTDTKVAWTQLASGDKVQIAAGLNSVTFTAVATSSSTPPALAKLYTSSFTVTDEPHRTNPGKYHIYDKTDPNVYILVISKDNTIKYNQPLNSTGFDVDLVDGDQIALTYFTQYYMTPL